MKRTYGVKVRARGAEDWIPAYCGDDPREAMAHIEQARFFCCEVMTAELLSDDDKPSETER